MERWTVVSGNALMNLKLSEKVFILIGYSATVILITKPIPIHREN